MQTRYGNYIHVHVLQELRVNRFVTALPQQPHSHKLETITYLVPLFSMAQFTFLSLEQQSHREQCPIKLGGSGSQITKLDV